VAGYLTLARVLVDRRSGLHCASMTTIEHLHPSKAAFDCDGDEDRCDHIATARIDGLNVCDEHSAKLVSSRSA
jgi:hypothetical protein